MKIYQSEEDGVIGDLLYQTVEFSQRELTEGGVGVISQGAVQRYLTGIRPDLKIKKLGSFKYDSQANTVLVRIGTPIEKKLLGLGYDELKTERDNLLLDYKNRSDELKELQEQHDKLDAENDRLVEANQKLVRESNKVQDLFYDVRDQYDALKKRYDALVVAVGKDAQKFSDLLVENEELKTENSDLREALHDGIDVADLADTNTIPTEVIKKVCDQAEVAGPDEVDGTVG